MKNLLVIRNAEERDVPEIFRLLEIYAKQGIVLRRSEDDIRFYLGNFLVAERGGLIRGCAAVRDFGGNLYEVRSVVVAPEDQGKGVGRAMIEAIVAGMRLRSGRWRLFTLTGQPEFFMRLGFHIVDRRQFPEKIWSDCANCPKNECCDEVALMIEPEG